VKEFRELTEDLSPEEQERLRRVHDLLVEAGPPPELPASLRRTPRPERQPFSLRRRAVAIALAAAIAVVAFGAGFFVGDEGDDFEPVRTVAMRGVGSAAGAAATIELGEPDDAGNYPVRLRVEGLQPVAREGYYELLLTRRGEAIASCGTFKVESEDTSVPLTVGYAIDRFDGWVVAAHPQRHLDNPPIVLRS
jgi:hypothetical protein